ncbi:hypothetical protein, partial [Paraburkholderia caribensis]|uniref:hypothetical protein n=1 Tax=Paraburkholderia caribensis TaxID=75105 RepID=UPI0020916F7D
MAFCDLASGFMRRRSWVLIFFWYPRCVGLLHASPFGVFGLCAGIRELLARFTRRPRAFAFALASAIRYRASRVAPVRGGTYFSLPPQRKVGKR